MIWRLLHDSIENSLKGFPVCGLLGSRQTGKSTLARAIVAERGEKAIYLDLERASDIAKLSEPELYLGRYSDRLIVLDEVQRKPEIFPLLRSLSDEWRRNGAFLVLGSASPSLIRQSSESLAGRIRYHELPPFTLEEVGKDAETIQRLWVRGGYPRSFLAESDKASFEWRSAFARTYLERDIPQLGIQIPASTLERFWSMVAHVHGNLWNASSIAQSLGVSPPTARHYLDILQDTFVVRQLQPYHVNTKKRLVKSPKIYLRDSGLLHTVLRMPTISDILGNPSAGASWEGFVIEQIITMSVSPADRFYFYRTSGGAEIDLVYLPPSRPPVAVEIKLSSSPSVSRGFKEGFKDLGCVKGFVVYSGKEAYPLDKSVVALPVSELGSVFA